MGTQYVSHLVHYLKVLFIQENYLLAGISINLINYIA